MQRVEIGNAVNAENHGLAVDDELLLPVLERAFNDPGISPRPNVAAARNQPNMLAIAPKSDAVAVVFDLVKPIAASRYNLAKRGQAKIEFKHEGEICADDRI